MNCTKLISLCAGIGLLLTVAGCAKKSDYKPCQIKSLKELLSVDYQETKERVTVRAKAFTKNDCDYVFGERVDWLITEKDPLQPIQLCIENRGSSAWKILDANIGLQMVPTKEIVKRLSRSSFATAGVCFGIGLATALVGAGIAVVCLPLGLGIGINAPAFVTPWIFGVLGGAGVVLAGSVFIVISPFVFLINTVKPGSESKAIDNYVHQTNIEKAIVIKQNNTIDILIFVRKDEFKPTFDVTLLNEQDQTKKQTFTVKLENRIITE